MTGQTEVKGLITPSDPTYVSLRNSDLHHRQEAPQIRQPHKALMRKDCNQQLQTLGKHQVKTLFLNVRPNIRLPEGFTYKK